DVVVVSDWQLEYRLAAVVRQTRGAAGQAAPWQPAWPLYSGSPSPARPRRPGFRARRPYGRCRPAAPSGGRPAGQCPPAAAAALALLAAEWAPNRAPARIRNPFWLAVGPWWPEGEATSAACGHWHSRIHPGRLLGS